MIKITTKKDAFHAPNDSCFFGKFIYVPVVILIVVIIFAYFNCKLSFPEEVAQWGQLGDFFGGVLNPIFGLLGFLALLHTIKLQRTELNHTLASRENSERAMQKQIFEGTFFSLLEQHNKSLDKLSEINEKRVDKSSDLDFVFNSVFLSNINTLQGARISIENHSELCGHYFRILYQLLKFIATNFPNTDVERNSSPTKIETQEVSGEEKMYSNIVRSFLGYKITQLLAAHCLCFNEFDPHWKFKMLIERYGFLEHMPFKISGNQNEILLLVKENFKKIAFGDSEFFEDLDQNNN